MKLVLLLLRESWWQAVFAIFSGLVSGACSARLIGLINDAVSNPQQPGLAAQFIGFTLVVLLTAPIAQYLLIMLSQGAVYRLRLRLSRRILAAPLHQLEALGINRLLATLTDDVANLSNAVFAIPFLCIDLAIIVGCLIYLGILSGPVFAFTLAMIGFGVGTTQFLLNQARHDMRRARNEQDNLLQHFQAITEGIKELKLNAFRRQNYLDHQLAVSADASRRYTTAALTVFAVASTWGSFLFFLIVGGLILVLPRLMAIDPLVLSGFVLTMTYLMVPFKNLMERLPVLIKSGVSLRKIEDLGLSLQSQAEDLSTSPDQLTALAPFRQLEFQDIFHTYGGELPEDRFSLGPINLTFEPGEVVFIVGGNGSGKSTLAKLITGLYIADTGRVFLNGEAIDSANLEWYRQHFTTVFSDFYLFKQLLGYGHADPHSDPHADPHSNSHSNSHSNLDQKAQCYLEELGLAHKVRIEKGELSTTSLSQGQRKRLALLTAYLDDRPIYLFDEWAADQDPGFRAVFYEEILPQLRSQGKLILAISHDDRYFDLADRVIKLDYGKIEYDQRRQCSDYALNEGKETLKRVP